VRDRYHIVGFISSGTYGRVYKAIGKNGQKGEFAIKKYVFAVDLGVYALGHASSSTNLSSPGLSRTRKANRSSIPVSPNQPSVRWLSVPNSRMPMLSSWKKLS
jgi:hypothetical protein